MNKIAAAVIALGLLPLAGCATPHGYSRYDSGPYAAYDANYDQGYDGYGQPGSAPYDSQAYGPPAYGPNGGYAGYSGPGYSGQAAYSQSYYGQSYGQPYG